MILFCGTSSLPAGEKNQRSGNYLLLEGMLSIDSLQTISISMQQIAEKLKTYSGKLQRLYAVFDEDISEGDTTTTSYGEESRLRKPTRWNHKGSNKPKKKGKGKAKDIEMGLDSTDSAASSAHYQSLETVFNDNKDPTSSSQQSSDSEKTSDSNTPESDLTEDRDLDTDDRSEEAQNGSMNMKTS